MKPAQVRVIHSDEGWVVWIGGTTSVLISQCAPVNRRRREYRAIIDQPTIKAICWGKEFSQLCIR